MTVDGGMGLHLAALPSRSGGGFAGLPVVIEGAGDRAGRPSMCVLHRVDQGLTAAMPSLMTGLWATGDKKGDGEQDRFVLAMRCGIAIEALGAVRYQGQGVQSSGWSGLK